MNMAVDVHAPSRPALVVGVLVAMLALIYYFIPAANTHIAFWLMTTAYVVASLGAMVKT
jgi:antibiotic biosynthesis monooxygenase (ABM) superfamily enzyme